MFILKRARHRTRAATRVGDLFVISIAFSPGTIAEPPVQRMMMMIMVMTMVMTMMIIMMMTTMVITMVMTMTTMRTSEVKLRNPKSFWDFEGVHLQHRVETVAASKAAA